MSLQQSLRAFVKPYSEAQLFIFGIAIIVLIYMFHNYSGRKGSIFDAMSRNTRPSQDVTQSTGFSAKPALPIGQNASFAQVSGIQGPSMSSPYDIQSSSPCMDYAYLGTPFRLTSHGIISKLGENFKEDFQ